MTKKLWYLFPFIFLFTYTAAFADCSDGNYPFAGCSVGQYMQIIQRYKRFAITSFENNYQKIKIPNFVTPPEKTKNNLNTAGNTTHLTTPAPSTTTIQTPTQQNSAPTSKENTWQYVF